MAEAGFSPTDVLRAPKMQEIEQAASALAGIIGKTPLLANKDVNEKLGGQLFIKAENGQRTGAFKIRGAYNRIRQMTADEKAAGAITYSSGNHGQAVACAAKMFGTNALIVMPDNAPAQKVAATKALGAQVTFFNRDSQNKDEVVENLRAESGRVIVPPSEDVRVLAGAGTVALEIIEQAGETGTKIDAVLVPCGGGGLTAVTAQVFAEKSPETKVYGVEPDLFDDTARSFEAGERLANPSGRKTICDAIMTDRPGALTFSINQQYLAGVLTVSDDAVRQAMRFAFDHYKTVIEPGGAVGLAAVLAGKFEMRGKNVVVIATGGNIDEKRFCGLLSSDAT